jgi:hypothetical protein
MGTLGYRSHSVVLDYKLVLSTCMCIDLEIKTLTMKDFHSELGYILKTDNPS